MGNMLDRPSAIGTMVVAMVVGAMFFLLMPMYIGALSDYAGFDNQQIGNLTFFELNGVALASLSSLFWIRRVDWRVVFAVSCATLAFSNALSILDHDFYWLVGTRFLAGVSEGGLLCIGYAALGDTKEVERNFGFSVIGQIMAPALFFVMLPGWLSEYGLSAIFVVQMVCALLTILLVSFFPPAGLVRDNKIPILNIGRYPLLGLLGLVVFYIGVTAVWGFLERMGVEEGFATQEIANILAISLIASVLGAVLASMIGVRYTRHSRFMVASLAALLLALMLLVDGMSLMTYAVAIVIYSLGWNLWIPYQLSSMAQVDDSGRIMGIVPLAQAFGISLGPLVAGQLLNGDDYLAINWIGAVTAVLALALFLPVCKAAAKRGTFESSK